MNNSGNPLINAVVSKLASDRDAILVQLDFILNKNGSNKDSKSIVDDAVDAFKSLSTIEKTIETVTAIIQENNRSGQLKKQIDELSNALIENNNKNPE